MGQDRAKVVAGVGAEVGTLGEWDADRHAIQLEDDSWVPAVVDYGVAKRPQTGVLMRVTRVELGQVWVEVA